MKNTIDNLDLDKLGELERKIEYTKMSINNLQTTLSSSDSSIDLINSTISSMSAEIEALNTSVDSISASIESLNSQISSINTEIEEQGTPQTIGNELDFIFNGTYVVDTELDEVLAGNYDDPSQQ